MIKPLLQDDELLKDARRAPASERSISLWWLGQSGFLLKHAPADRLSFAPDCGLSQTARWAAKQKLRNMVEGVRIVRKELGV